MVGQQLQRPPVVVASPWPPSQLVSSSEISRSWGCARGDHCSRDRLQTDVIHTDLLYVLVDFVVVGFFWRNGNSIELISLVTIVKYVICAIGAIGAEFYQF